MVGRSEERSPPFYRRLAPCVGGTSGLFARFIPRAAISGTESLDDVADPAREVADRDLGRRAGGEVEGDDLGAVLVGADHALDTLQVQGDPEAVVVRLDAILEVLRHRLDEEAGEVVDAERFELGRGASRWGPRAIFFWVCVLSTGGVRCSRMAGA